MSASLEPSPPLNCSTLEVNPSNTSSSLAHLQDHPSEANWYSGRYRFQQIEAPGYGEIKIHGEDLYCEGPNTSIQIRDKNDFSIRLELKGAPGYDEINYLYCDEEVIVTYSTCGCGASMMIWKKEDGACLLETSSTRFIAVDEDSVVANTYKYENGANLYQLCLFNTHSGKLISELNHQESNKCSCIPIFDGHFVIAGFDNGTIQCWNRFNGTFIHEIKSSQELGENGVSCLAVDGDRLIAAHQGGLIKIWDKNNGILMHAFQATCNEAFELIVDRDLLFSISDKTVSVSNMATGKEVYSLKINGPCRIDADRLIWVAEARDIQISNKYDGSPILLINTDSADSYLRYILDGDRLISYNIEGKVQIWNKNNGALFATLLESYEGKLSCVDLILDGNRLISRKSQKIRVWDFSS